MHVPGPQIVLIGLSPKVAGLHWQSAGGLRIGRSVNNDVVLDDMSVSRLHAEVVPAGHGWLARDLGSKYGTTVNGAGVDRAGQRLRHEDVLECGSVALRVTLAEEPAGSAPDPAPDSGLPTPVIAGAPLRIKSSGKYLTIQASVQHSWEQALQVVASDGAQPPRHGKHLLTLLRTGHHLTHLGSLDELLQSILDDAVSALDAQRGAIVLADEPTGELRLRAVSLSGRARDLGRYYSRTLTERCFQEGESFLCSDASKDVRVKAAGSVLHGAMSSIVCALLRSPRQRLGVLHLDRGPLQDAFTPDEFYLADAIAASVSVAIESAQLVERQRGEFIGTITALARAVEVRDQYTADHTQRVTDYSLILAEALKLPAAERYHIQIGTPLHDIGKIGIADAILRKPGRLTPDEFEAMKTHTLKGAAILETIPALRPVIPIVRNHHERWDGSGYPDRVAGGQIPQLARIVAVADAFDAMTSDRPYRPALAADAAFAELVKQAGKHFDPACVQAFVRLRARIEARLHGTPLNGTSPALPSGQPLNGV
jgi:HD-GYP domain-containing protein (c-di-GMP phosphodiesterase class II)